MRKSLYIQHVYKPAVAVWAFIADLRNDRLWRREITEVKLLSGEPPSAPAVYEETVEWEGLKTHVTLQVTESVEAALVVVLNEGSDYSSRSQWSFEAHGDMTIVSLAFSFEATGALRLAEPFMWTIVSGWLERDLPLLEGHLSSL